MWKRFFSPASYSRAVTEDVVAWAHALSEQLLAEALPRRWAHTQAVAARARALTVHLEAETAVTVEAAAWLHDIGYAPAIATSGFHPLDGARFLRDDQSADGMLCDLVAHHTGAAIEAEERGMAAELQEFGSADRHPRLLGLLTAADMTCGPDGSLVTPPERIAEIVNRYEPEDPVHRAITRSGPALIATAQRVLVQDHRPTRNK